MRCIAANRSVLTALDQNNTYTDDNGSNRTAMTNDIQCSDTIQFADGWYSYPDLNTFDSDLLLDVLTIRHIKPTKAISPWNVKAENPTALPLTEIATRQLEALFNLSQLLFGLARAEQSNYTFRDLQLGKPARRFRAIDIVFMMYKDPRIRCVKQKSLDLLSNVTTIGEVARSILDRHSEFTIQLIQGIRDGHLIEEKIPSLSVLIRLCKVIVEKNLLGSYQHLIDMQFIDILIDLFENEQYKSIESIIYFIKFESLALQCLNIMLQCAEHVDMWSEKAQIRLVNYCCTLLHKSVLDNNQRSKGIELNHIIYGEEHGIVHSLSYGMLTFWSVVRCRKEIGKFYRENEHFRELLTAMRHKYGARSEYQSRDPSIGCALDQVVNVMFHRQERKKKRYPHHQRNRIENEEGNENRKCSNSLCQIIENHQIQFQDCPHCHKLSYCSQYCREVHWTLNHNLSCRSVVNQNEKKEESTVSMSHHLAFETLPVQISEPVIEITNDLCYPSSSSSSSTDKKKSFKTLLSFLRVSGKRR